jgi:hypothetical protein
MEIKDLSICQENHKMRGGKGQEEEEQNQVIRIGMIFFFFNK